MLGSYVIKCSTDYPQKVIAGFDMLFNNPEKPWVGSKFEPIAYLGEQQVSNSKNHALICYQILTTANDEHRIVLMELNEKNGDLRGETITLVNIKPLLTDNGSKKLGGISITPATGNNISEEAKAIFKKRFEGFGANNKLVAVLATQIVNGVAYYFLTESSMFIKQFQDNDIVINLEGNTKAVMIAKAYANYNEKRLVTVLEGIPTEDEFPSINPPDDSAAKFLMDTKATALGYAFTW